MALRRILLAVAGAAAFACPAHGQTSVPAYRSQGGQVQDGIGTQALAPMRGPTTQAGATIAAANTFQTAIPASDGRFGCLLQNTSNAAMYVYVGTGTATTAASLIVGAGATFNCASASGLVLTGAVSVASGTAGATYVTLVQ